MYWQAGGFEQTKAWDFILSSSLERPVCVVQTGHSGLTASAKKKKNKSRQNVRTEQEKSWPGISGGLCGRQQPPPPHTPSPTPCLALHPLLQPRLAGEDGFSESSWDPDQRQITADVYAKCNMETPQLCPRYWFPLLPFSHLPSPPPFLLISLLHFNPSTIYYRVWNLKEDRRSWEPSLTEESDSAVLRSACLYLKSWKSWWYWCDGGHASQRFDVYKGRGCDTLRPCRLLFSAN